MDKKIGIIGIGNVGSMILSKIIEHSIYKEENIFVANRSAEKLDSIKLKYPKINTVQSNTELAGLCNNIIISVEPLNLPGVFHEISSSLDDDAYLMISTSMVGIKDIHKFYKGSVTIFMPTLISMVNGGVTLSHHGENVQSAKKQIFENIMSRFSEIKLLSEEDISLAQNLTASFPGFFAAIMLEFIKSVSKKSKSVTDGELEHMLLISLLGASRLLLEKDMSFEETINRVSTKGGITYEGVKVFEKMLPNVFDTAIEASMNRYNEITKTASKNISDIINL